MNNSCKNGKLYFALNSVLWKITFKKSEKNDASVIKIKCRKMSQFYPFLSISRFEISEKIYYTLIDFTNNENIFSFESYKHNLLTIRNFPYF